MKRDINVGPLDYFVIFGALTDLAMLQDRPDEPDNVSSSHIVPSLRNVEV